MCNVGELPGGVVELTGRRGRRSGGDGGWAEGEFISDTVEPRYNNEHRAFNSYSYNEVIAISNQGLSDHVPHHL
jgi:hypothetical protein